MHRIVVAAIALTGALTAASTAYGQQQGRFCASIDQVVKRLGSEFGEHLSAAGLGSQGQMMAIYSNPESGTWTITVTTPDRVSCVIATGKGFAIEVPEIPGEAS
jgi:hypothetical protein